MRFFWLACKAPLPHYVRAFPLPFRLLLSACFLSIPVIVFALIYWLPVLLIDDYPPEWRDFLVMLEAAGMLALVFLSNCERGIELALRDGRLTRKSKPRASHAATPNNADA